MARARARNLLALLAGLLLAGGCSSPVAAQNRPVAAHPVPPAAVLISPVRAPPPAVVGVAAAAPSAPVSRLWQFKRLYDVDYVDVRVIAERFDLKVTWAMAGRIMQLADARGRV